MRHSPGNASGITWQAVQEYDISKQLVVMSSRIMRREQNLQRNSCSKQPGECCSKQL